MLFVSLWDGGNRTCSCKCSDQVFGIANQTKQGLVGDGDGATPHLVFGEVSSILGSSVADLRCFLQVAFFLAKSRGNPHRSEMIHWGGSISDGSFCGRGQHPLADKRLTRL